MSVTPHHLELDHETFKKFAFNTHPLAYLDGGIAHLPASDLWNIAKQPRMQEWGSWNTTVQAFETGRGSLVTWGSGAVDSVSSKTGDLVNQALDFLMRK
jgi:hypothetical protein